jgi:hypothetical protein
MNVVGQMATKKNKIISRCNISATSFVTMDYRHSDNTALACSEELSA